ncbi:MAG: rhomboid family intramembrane serine protease [Verrucomicrobiae bacterium]|nr:rhomboid family intramembrane serine protease [Verrucomicrobiae bacterium]
MSDIREQIAGYYPDVPEDEAPALAEQAGLAQVGSYPSRSGIEEHGLVLLSIGLPYWVFRIAESETPFQLYVRQSVSQHVERELERYDIESAAWQQAIKHDPLPSQNYRAGIHFAFAYVIALLAAFRMQIGDANFTDRFTNDNHAFFYNHEWWRPLTALLLHADTGHLLSNLAMGVLFGLFCSKSMGAPLAWALILSGGVLGNILTSWSYLPDSHVALGASTAVFAAVGALTGHGGAETMQDRSRVTLFRKAIPLLGGLVLLGFYGFGPDPRTDVVAHVWGFVSGSVLGLVAGVVQIRKLLQESSV